MRYTIHVEKTHDGYLAHCDEVGVTAGGRTAAEAVENLKAAIAGLLAEGYRQSPAAADIEFFLPAQAEVALRAHFDPDNDREGAQDSGF